MVHTGRGSRESFTEKKQLYGTLRCVNDFLKWTVRREHARLSKELGLRPGVFVDKAVACSTWEWDC